MNPVTAELLRIAEEHAGHIHPADVVEAARPAESVLHSRFEWSDTEAARKYRLVQAQELIRVAVVVVGDHQPMQTRCFVSLTPDRTTKQGYRKVVDVLNERDMRAQMLEDARHDLAALRQKYAALSELVMVWAAVDALPPPGAPGSAVA